MRGWPREGGHVSQPQCLRIQSTLARSGIRPRLQASAGQAKSSDGRTRAWREGCVSSCELCFNSRGKASCVGPCPFSIGLLKDTYNLGFQFREFHCEHDSLRMEDQVTAGGQEIEVLAQDFAHPALNSVTLVRFAEHFASCEAYSREI